MPQNADKNRCRKDEIAHILPLAVTRPRRGPAPPSPPVAQVRRAVPPRDDNEEEDTSTRLFTMEQKKDMFRRYFEWVEAGKIRADSPIDELVEAYGCSRAYPKRLFDKVLKNGTAENQWDGGRPLGGPRTSRPSVGTRWSRSSASTAHGSA